MIACSIIKKSELERSLRLDAEYYQPEYLEIADKLEKVSHKTLEEISESVISFGAYSLTSLIEWKDKGVPYINVSDVRDGIISFDNIKYISEDVNKILKKSQVKEGQVVLTMAGTIGEVAVAHQIPDKVNSNQATAKISVSSQLSPYYLVAFLNSYYGKKQTEREIVSSVQPNIFLGQIKKFIIPLFNKQEQENVEGLYKKGLREFQNSESLYLQAENLFLQQLGLKDFEPKEELTYSVKFSEIKDAQRMDAEYFQPKYEKLLKKVKEKNVLKRLGDLAVLKRGSLINPNFYDQENGTPYIRGGDFSSGQLENSGLVFISSDFKKTNETTVDVGDLVFALIGSVRTVGVVPEDFNNSYISNNVGKISVKDRDKVLPDYLNLVLQSIVGQSQFDKEMSQTAQPKISDKQVANFQIPVLEKGIQQKISNLVRKSHEARKKAKELLEQAKQKVEELIEKGK